MMTSIRTDRLYLRPMTDNEWTAILDRIFDAGECFVQFGYEDSEALRESVAEPYREAVVYYSIHMPFAREMVGYVEYCRANDNLGFYIFEEYRRKGLGYEGVKAFMDACMTGEVTGSPVCEFYAQTFDDNVPSINLLKKLGFKGTGHRFILNAGFGVEEFECAA